MLRAKKYVCQTQNREDIRIIFQFYIKLKYWFAKNNLKAEKKYKMAMPIVKKLRVIILYLKFNNQL